MNDERRRSMASDRRLDQTTMTLRRFGGNVYSDLFSTLLAIIAPGNICLDRFDLGNFLWDMTPGTGRNQD